MKSESLQDCFCGAVTVGERGQVVIPAEARKQMGIQSGEKLLVVLHPAGNALMLFKVERVKELLSTFLDGLSRFEQDLAASGKPPKSKKK